MAGLVYLTALAQIFASTIGALTYMRTETMAICYHMIIQMKTLTGMLEIGSFVVSTDREFAFEAFNRLKGKTAFTESQVLRLVLLERKGDSDLVIESIGCNLDELSENCKVITKAAFKFFNLEK